DEGRLGSAARALAAQGTGTAPGRRQSRRARRPEHRREAEALAERAAGDAADHARSAVTEDGIERLATAAEAPGEVARDDGDAGRRRVQQLGRRRQSPRGEEQEAQQPGDEERETRDAGRLEDKSARQDRADKAH